MTDSALTRLQSYQRLRRITLAALLALVFAVLLFGQSLFPPETPVHEAIEMIGIVLIFVGIAGRLWSTLYIGGRKSVSVVTDGPYSITRNPLYVFSSIAAMGVGAQMGSITAMVGFGLACAAAFHIVILREEKYLAGQSRRPTTRLHGDGAALLSETVALQGRRHRRLQARPSCLSRCSTGLSSWSPCRFSRSSTRRSFPAPCPCFSGCPERYDPDGG